MEDADVEYNEWIARKEMVEEKAFLHLFVEADPENELSEAEFRDRVKESLIKTNDDIKSMEEMLGYDPLKLNILNPGAFHAYMEYQKSQGADLAHTKPPHMNPTKEQLGVLIKEKKFKSD